MIKQEFSTAGFHRLVDTSSGEVTAFASYRQPTYLNGSVGVTDYFTGKGEMIITPLDFVLLTAVQKEVVQPSGKG